MALYLVYSPNQTYDNSNGRNAVIVDAADEAAARGAAGAAATSGETKTAGWQVTLLSGIVPVWVQGRPVPPRRSRGA
jgi:hypothetical protein